MPRVAGVRIYENLISILFILRDAPKISIYENGKQILVQGMAVKDIHKSLENQGERLKSATVNRYLNQLETQRPPQVELVHTGDKNAKYWALPENSPLRNTTISDFEAAMIVLSSQALESVLPPTLRQHLKIAQERAQGKLNNFGSMGVLPENSPIWVLKLINRVWVEKPPALSGNIQEIIFNALRAKKRLRIKYLSNDRAHKNQPAIESYVSPVRLIQHGDARLYLIVTESSNTELFDHHDAQHRKYHRLAVHRIKEAELIDQEAVFPTELQNLIDAEPGFGWAGKIKLKALISTGIALRLEECALNETQNLSIKEGSDWHLLEVVVDHNWELRWWILSHGKHIIVQEPKEFRDELSDHFKIGYQQYFPSKESGFF